MVGILNYGRDPGRARECRDELWAYLDPVIEDRRKNPKDDVISQLIHDEVDGVRPKICVPAGTLLDDPEFVLGMSDS